MFNVNGFIYTLWLLSHCLRHRLWLRIGSMYVFLMYGYAWNIYLINDIIAGNARTLFPSFDSHVTNRLRLSSHLLEWMSLVKVKGAGKRRTNTAITIKSMSNVKQALSHTYWSILLCVFAILVAIVFFFALLSHSLIAYIVRCFHNGNNGNSLKRYSTALFT